jgi:hypothetical protein
MMDRLRDEKFDIVIGQLLDQCIYGLVKKVGTIPYILISSAPLSPFIAKKVGVMIPSSCVPGKKNMP